MVKRKIAAVLLLITCVVNAQEINKQEVKNEVLRILDSINKAKLPDTKSGGGVEEHWYDRISLRGYAQIRYNGLLSTNDKVSIVEQSHLFWSSLISKHFITSLHHDSLASYVPHCQTPPNPTNPPVQTPWPRQNHPVSYPLQSPLPFFRPHVTLPYRGLLTGAVRPGATQHSPHQ